MIMFACVIVIGLVRLLVRPLNIDFKDVSGIGGLELIIVVLIIRAG